MGVDHLYDNDSRLATTLCDSRQRSTHASDCCRTGLTKSQHVTEVNEICRDYTTRSNLISVLTNSLTSKLKLSEIKRDLLTKAKQVSEF